MADLVDSGTELGVLQRNTETADRLRKRATSRLYEEQAAPKALEEKLPPLPGIRRL